MIDERNTTVESETRQGAQVAIIDPPGTDAEQQEQEEEEFSTRLHDAVSQLPREKQESLLLVIEEAAARTPRAMHEAIAGKEEDDEEQVPSTGSAALDELLDQVAWADKGAAYASLRLAAVDPALGQRIVARLEPAMQDFRDDTYGNLDKECDVMPAKEWLAFLDGTLLGKQAGPQAPADPKASERRCTMQKADGEFRRVTAESEEERQLRQAQERLADKQLQVARAVVGKATKGWLARKVHAEILDTAAQLVGGIKQYARGPLGEILTRTDCLPAQIIHQAIAEARAEVQKVLDDCQTVKGMEAQVRAVVATLPARSKAIIGVVISLADLESISEVDFGSSLLRQDLGDYGNIEEALTECAGDPDIDVMQRAYDLAQRIEADAEPENQQEESADTSENSESE